MEMEMRKKGDELIYGLKEDSFDVLICFRLLFHTLFLSSSLNSKANSGNENVLKKMWILDLFYI